MVKKYGNLKENIIASCKACSAFSSPTTYVHLLLSFSVKDTDFSRARSFDYFVFSPELQPSRASCFTIRSGTEPPCKFLGDNFSNLQILLPIEMC